MSQDPKAEAIKYNLLKWAGFKIAPGCNKGCHRISPEGIVMATAEAMKIAAQKLLIYS